MHMRTFAVSGAVVLAAALGAAPASAATAGPASGSTGLSLAVTPHTIDFGGVPLGTTSAPQTLTVTNTSGAESDLITFDAPGQVNFVFYTISDGCSQVVLAPGASCTVSITFHPEDLNPPPLKMITGEEDLTLEVLGTKVPVEMGQPGQVGAVVKVRGRATSGQ